MSRPEPPARPEDDHAATPAPPPTRATRLSAHAGAESPVMDTFGRTVNYLRFSVTDRCNLRCFYCRAGDDLSFIPHRKILRYEEILTLIEIAQAMGVRKVRLTGGEPLVRRDFIPFLKDATQRFPAMDFRLTTNGVALAKHVDALRAIGLSAVNISLDALDRERFASITGVDAFDRVWKGFEASLAAGLPVKLNAVAMRDMNRQDLAGFVALAREHPIHVRFIEFMPMGAKTQWSDAHFWSADDILEDIRRHATLTPLPVHSGDPPDRQRDPDGAERDGPLLALATGGPARMFAIEGGRGAIGVISPMTNHFCASCNRLRITSDGRLRTCLFSDQEYRLRPLLRHPALGPAAVRRVIEKATRRKPLGHALLRKTRAASEKRMSAIGG